MVNLEKASVFFYSGDKVRRLYSDAWDEIHWAQIRILVLFLQSSKILEIRRIIFQEIGFRFLLKLKEKFIKILSVQFFLV